MMLFTRQCTGIFTSDALAVMRQRTFTLPSVLMMRAGNRFISYPSTSGSNRGSAHASSVDSGAHSLQFRDAQKAYQGLSAGELMKRLAVFTVLRLPGVSNNAPRLLTASNALFGRRVTHAAVRHTVFHQFCGGENLDALVTRGRTLSQMGIGSIVDYAAESEDTVVSFSSNLELTLHSIECAARVANESRPRGTPGRPAFTAIKITSLANPVDLRRLTTVLHMLYAVFFAAAEAADTPLTSNALSKAIQEHLHIPHHHIRVCNITVPRARLAEAAQLLWGAPAASRVLDIWSPKQASGGEFFHCTSYESLLALLRTVSAPQLPEQLPEVHRCLIQTSWPDQAFLQHIQESTGRVNKICTTAQTHSVRLLVDAEQTFFQAAIDWFARNAMEKYNRQSHVTVYNTHQMYLRSALERLKSDAKHAALSGFTFATKIVRGAYMVQEAAVAREHGYTNPVHPNLESSHRSYDEAVRFMVYDCPKLAVLPSCGPPEVLLGTHNESSITKAVDLIRKYPEPERQRAATTRVAFGQLLGMSDHISRVLSSEGFCTYKYVPFGELDVVIPYLLRRAQENAGVFNSSAVEIQLMIRELKRRASCKLALGTLTPRAANAHAP